MNPTERRRKLYEKISSVRNDDPDFFLRKASEPIAIAQQAYHNSLIEGCDVSLKQLLDTAELLLKRQE